MQYRRLYVPGGTYFFTLVTANRAPIFNDEKNVGILRKAIAEVKNKRPFKIIAAVILPEHLHMIWALPKGDTDYSTRIAHIKSNFTRSFLASGGKEQPISTSQKHKEYRGVWQARFMEHTCRDESDLGNHIDYIHINPVKHGYVKKPAQWRYSSIHKFIQAGSIPQNWNLQESENNLDDIISTKILE